MNKGNPLESAEALEESLRKGMDPNGPAPDGRTMLQVCARAGNAKAVSALIEHGADVDATSPLLLTPLHYAVIGGHTGICRALLEAGADPNKSHHGSDLPLQQAIVRRHGQIVRLLLAHGADPRRIIGSGGTASALDLAEDSGDGEIVRMISEAAGPLPDRSACKCHRLPRSDLAGPLAAETCLERRIDVRLPSRYPVYQCRETGLMWEVAGYDERGIEFLAFTLAEQSVPLFLDRIQKGDVIASASYISAQQRRLKP